MTDRVCRRTIPVMGTIVTIDVVSTDADVQQAIEGAFDWFRRVETCCTRFEADSEAMQLTTKIGVAAPVSEILFEAVQFALAVAEETGGAFDPTVGYSMETRGYNREYRTLQAIHTALEPAEHTSYRDVRVDPDRKTITLLRPLILDLGAVAKGLAIDLAARELQRFQDFSIDAGGDLFLGGLNPDGAPWSIGIRHPREDNALIGAISVTDRAVCTSGDYERRSSETNEHHILDPRLGTSAKRAASVTIVASNAMLADALATAAFVMGPDEGIRLLEHLGVEGLIITPDLEQYPTRGMRREYKLSHATIL